MRKYHLSETATVLVVLVVVLLSFGSVATAAGYWWARDARDQPAVTPTLPSVWPTKNGQAVRSVPIPTGEMVAALPPDTAGHVLCQSLSREQWEALLGGETLREVENGGCHVVTDTLDVRLYLDGTPANLQDPEQVDVAGHSGELEALAPEVNARMNVRLVDDAATEQIKPFLRLDISRSVERPGPGVDDLAGSVAKAVVQATMTPGPDLPKRTSGQAIPAQTMAPAPDHGIVDAPWPMISWQLCTALTKQLHATARPRFDGTCTARGVTVAYTDDASPRVFPQTLAGRPASISDDAVAVKLTDDSAQTVTFTGGSSLKELAESMLPSLLGR
ncbi:hypothetical protein [Amycolatopsis sp.]|uniref:hypothetical protein n=1 Tax=Amycolatopsis sp. TaxID=37632 RepID=UPI002B72D1CE|nr:hypothetical protein [Amycolatopsis sp.]HVV11647.1 hypothetical protein [Amycolatopsis sp.]